MYFDSRYLNDSWIKHIRDLLPAYEPQVAILESLLSSAYRTSNAEEADFFYVPVLGACAIIRADEAPHMNIQVSYMLPGEFTR